MLRHKARKHNISEYVIKVPSDDGKERDKCGSIIKLCGIGGCSYKTS